MTEIREEDTIRFKEGDTSHSIIMYPWVPEIIRKKLRDAVDNGLTRKEFWRIYGNARICSVFIDQCEDEETKKILLKEFPAASWFMFPKIRFIDIKQRLRTLQGLARELKQVQIPIEEIIQDSEWKEEKDSFKVISKTGMAKILRYFRDQGGNYIGIYRDYQLHVNHRNKKNWYVETILVVGEVPKRSHSDKILLDKYIVRNLTKKRNPRRVNHDRM